MNHVLAAEGLIAALEGSPIPPRVAYEIDTPPRGSLNIPLMQATDLVLTRRLPPAHFHSFLEGAKGWGLCRGEFRSPIYGSWIVACVLFLHRMVADLRPLTAPWLRAWYACAALSAIS